MRPSPGQPVEEKTAWVLDDSRSSRTEHVGRHEVIGMYVDGFVFVWLNCLSALKRLFVNCRARYWVRATREGGVPTKHCA